MNTISHDFSIAALINEAAYMLHCHPSELDWWSWPHMFASTCGPQGGIGGQALTSFQVFAFVQKYSEADGLKFCNGIWKTWPADEHYPKGW